MASVAKAQPVAAVTISELIDCDANLLHPDLIADLDPLVARAQASGVVQFIVPGSTLDDSAGALDLSVAKAGVCFGTAGMHPYHCHSAPTQADLDQLHELGSRDECVAIGECGLDNAEGFPAAELQLPWFTAQLDLAKNLNKPVFLHERLAFEAVSAELTARKDDLPPVLVHCFTGTAEELSWYLDFGCYVGFTGFVFNKKRAAALRECLQSGQVKVPLDRVVIETDAPYMGFKRCRTAEPKNPTKTSPNVPSALPRILSEVAALLGVESDVLGAATTANARRLFQLSEVLSPS
eukprot:m.465448 g.465448  ORF g.465448 m.465448 type:complete len:294 (-) comp24227_c0_seq1:339-1220(-)